MLNFFPLMIIGIPYPGYFSNLLYIIYFITLLKAFFIIRINNAIFMTIISYYST
jgi:hypothetical protein